MLMGMIFASLIFLSSSHQQNDTQFSHYAIFKNRQLKSQAYELQGKQIQCIYKSDRYWLTLTSYRDCLWKEPPISLNIS